MLPSNIPEVQIKENCKLFPSAKTENKNVYSDRNSFILNMHICTCEAYVYIYIHTSQSNKKRTRP